MVFACQRDSFQQTLISKVNSCQKGEGDDGTYYEVICEDSILFPEGGGQPWDTGFLNEIPVHCVLRKGDEAVMYVKEPLEVGQEVKQTVDWNRRFDHMQQHSGQHLITAIINSEYKIETTSWWLGEKISHIELNTKQLSPNQISNIEFMVNKKIMEQTPVNVKLCQPGDESLLNARTRGLPKDVNGPIRIIEIVGLESDLCCGTHREEKLTSLLKSEPGSHADLVVKLQRCVKVTNKRLVLLLKEIAISEGNKFMNIKPQPRYYCFHRKNADSDYLDSFWRTIRDCKDIEKTFFMLAAGEEEGNLLLQGKEEDIVNLGPQIVELLSGKGAAQGPRFQAKVMKLSNFNKAEDVLKNYFKC